MNPTFEDVWDVIAKVRDDYPREATDAPTEAIVDALIDAGYIQIADPS